MPRRASLLISLLSLLICSSLRISAQSYPLAIPDSAIENPQVLHARNWPTTLGLPNPSITRSNAGERWYLIETARGQFSPTFGNLFTPDTGWVDIARAHRTDLIYTFSAAPAWAVQGAKGPSADSAPYDIDEANETCMAPIAGESSPDGNCIWKEWITALMQKNCDVAKQPDLPLTGHCRIRYFEAWNEFNAANFWADSLAHLAKMANDMAIIVRVYCGDCKIIGGSTSAGGIDRSSDSSRSGSGRFDVALGEFLDAWHAIPNASLPDIISFHAYPARTNIGYPPFPETNISINDPRCTSANVPNVYCYVPIADQSAAVRRILAARPYLLTTTPVWNTESGWGRNGMLLHGVAADGSADAPTGYLRQAFFARETILLANQGIPVNIWYEADHQCDGTLFGFGLPSTSDEMWQGKNDPSSPTASPLQASHSTRSTPGSTAPPSPVRANPPAQYGGVRCAAPRSATQSSLGPRVQKALSPRQCCLQRSNTPTSSTAPKRSSNAASTRCWRFGPDSLTTGAEPKLGSLVHN